MTRLLDLLDEQEQRFEEIVELEGPPDNVDDVRASFRRIREREEKIEADKEAMAEQQEQKFDTAVAAGRYHSNGRPTDAELERIAQRREENRQDWRARASERGKPERLNGDEA